MPLISTDSQTNPIEIPSGTRIYDVIMQYPDIFPPNSKNLSPTAATMNNELVSLSDKIQITSHIQLVYPDTVSGSSIYRKSLVFLLQMAWNNICPARQLTISHSIGHAFYFKEVCQNDTIVIESSDLQGEMTTPAPKHNSIDHIEFDMIKKEMQNLIKQNLPILTRKPISSENIIQILTNQAQPESADVVRSKNENRVFTSQCGNYYQLMHTPLVPTTGSLKQYRLLMIEDMIVIVYPSHTNHFEIPEFQHNATIHQLYQENQNWSKVLKVSSLGQLNAINRDERLKSYIQICESRQNQRIGEVCKLILNGRNQFCVDGPITVKDAYKTVKENFNKNSIVIGRQATVQDEIKLVMISGPSSAGKTTFAKKLQYNLTVMGRNPIVLSMDNYFVNRVDTPLGPDGQYDFEHVESLDIPLFNKDLSNLLLGKQIESPIYNFKTGEREQKKLIMSLPYRGCVIIEGIHALNPLLTKSVPIQQKFGIFIQPLTSINVDETCRISTRDYRMIRRIVRDKKYRNCSAERTIELFTNVRKGEERWVFPNQGRADVYFNTALDYELMVLSTYVIPLLHEVNQDSDSYMEARRVIQFLSWVQGINSDYVPKHSILREFIGGSAFNYD
ncbi:Uridine kinase [Spironucleus salmonicida]|uniref:Uridine kinase n=1 Tax=Spironucleus salmonicida TaxID=348837 RepID=V6LVN2_9EUKA|nr:Uridine kinase [Spironucleus salmonicida]|eukprot:EST48677.1 Uridine kinase [Spironucleus salmonicida]